MRRILIPLIAVAVLIGAALWVFRDRAAPRAPMVLAAASLQGSLDAAAEAWSAQGHAKPVISFAGSSALARQIEAGAAADLFISADEQWMDAVQSKGLVRSGTRATMLGNSLVLIAPAASKVTLDPTPGFALAAALGNGRLALADPAGVPAGRYAKQALQKLDVWDQVEGRIAAGDNVRAALALVARGEAPLGIVYATDALAEPKVRVVATFPATSHVPITYPVAVLSTSRSPDAEPLRAFLLSPEAQAVFRRFGFTARPG